MAQERHECWSHLGFERDVFVFSKGGASHWVEVRSIETGEQLSLERLNGKDARKRAISRAIELSEEHAGKVMQS